MYTRYPERITDTVRSGVVNRPFQFPLRYMEPPEPIGCFHPICNRFEVVLDGTRLPGVIPQYFQVGFSFSEKRGLPTP